MSGHRPSRVAHDLLVQRAVRALPDLPPIFTPKQLRRLLPDRSPDQCRRLIATLVARGYCARSSKHSASPLPATPHDTPSDRVLALFTGTGRITIAQARTVIPGTRQAAQRLLERMVDLGLLRKHHIPIDGPPHWRNEYEVGRATQRVAIPVPLGCRDPHCACPLAESDYDVRQGRLVRTVCRRHELTADLEALACSR